jgi:hypothetical protein
LVLLLKKEPAMIKKSISHTDTILEYFQQGEAPRLLIHSGMHGDEFSVIPIVHKAIEQHESSLPEFIFVPEVSPSAVSLQTRKSARGLDLNRSFFENSQDSEVLANMQLVLPHKFDLLVSFHEDIEFNGFYMYDSGYAQHRETILSFCKNVKASGIQLFTGVDDKTDPVHGYTVVNGHVLWGIEWNKPLNGTFDDWAIKNGIIKRLIMPEIPTSLSTEKKEQIIDRIFTELIIPFFSL